VNALGLLLGLGVSLSAFYLVIGIWPVWPQLERYSMWLITPSCLVGALLWRSLGTSEGSWHGQLVGALVLAGLLLSSFDQHYFQRIRETGGESERAFRTGPVEPKQAAFAYLSDRG